jgi:hypothetical protein
MDNKTLPALWGRISAEGLAQLTGAHITSARRWKRLPVLPQWLARFVRVLVEGHLEEIAGAWTGWRIVAGELIAPEGWTFTPGDIRALPFMRQQIAHFQALQRIPAQADFMEGWQRVPDALQHDAAPKPGAEVVYPFAADAISPHSAPYEHHREHHNAHHAREHERRA